MSAASATPRIDLLLRILDEAYDRKAWHGTTLRGSIRGLTLEQVLARPARGRHNIAELVLHAAYWKYTVRRRITGEKRGSFSLPGSDWFEAGARFSADAWSEAVRILQDQHDALRATVAALGETDLDRQASGKGVWTISQIISGVAAHDLYHAGQIQLVKRLTGDR